MRLITDGARPVSGVVRFRRDDKHGFDGQFLEMQKRCSDFTCGTACSINCAGFVPFGGEDWTTSTTTAANTKFTIFLVMKTYQQPGDVNPMGIINLATGGAKTGFGLYTIPSTCTPALRSSIAVADTNGPFSTMPHIYLKTDGSGSELTSTALGNGKGYMRSTVPNTYNGMWLHFHDVFDPQITLQTQPLRRTSLRCKIKQYLVVGYLKTDLTTVATTATLVGGAGSISGVACATMDSGAGNLGQKPTIRFGRVDTTGADILVSACAVGTGDDIADTVITLGTTTGTLRPAGTAVYFATGKTNSEFYTTVIDTDSCTGKQLDDTPTANLQYNTKITADTEVSIIPGDGVNCKADEGNGKAPFGRLSTISAYYGAAAAISLDNSGDAACQSECETFGCDPTSGNYGHPTKVLEGELAVALTTAGVT